MITARNTDERTAMRQRHVTPAMIAALLSPFLLLSMPAAYAQPDLYRGKTIRLIVGQAAGGGYDAYGRLLAPFLTQFLPGQPAVTVQNMPGAGSILMANYLFTQAPRDGTVIALGGGSIAPAALFGATGARFDSRQFSWIGSMNNEKGVTVAWHTAPITKAADIFEREFVVGGAGLNADSVIFPNAINRVLATRYKVVSGYQGSAETVLAMERGEVQGIGNWNYSSILANRPDWLRDKKINVILQLGLGPHPQLPGVPTVMDIARTDAERDTLRIVFAQQSIGRPVLGPPGMAEAPLATLRNTFDAIMRDPQFLAEANRRKLEINEPMTGKAAQQVVDRLYAADPELIRKAAAAVKPAAASAPN
jgi:tripartite-type tricarboxylate transporter receptor subunit TctC